MAKCLVKKNARYCIFCAIAHKWLANNLCFVKLAMKISLIVTIELLIYFSTTRSPNTFANLRSIWLNCIYSFIKDSAFKVSVCN